jgi:hypothetical protein
VFLTKFQMERLTTARLLAYKNKLITKSHPSWQEAYKNIKEVLTTREHVE